MHLTNNNPFSYSWSPGLMFHINAPLGEECCNVDICGLVSVLLAGVNHEIWIAFRGGGRKKNKNNKSENGHREIITMRYKAV